MAFPTSITALGTASHTPEPLARRIKASNLVAFQRAFRYNYKDTVTMDNLAPTAMIVLIVDDEIEIRAILIEEISYLGYQVLEAGGVQEAKEILLNNPVDIILTDLSMPEGGGTHLIAWVSDHLATKPPIIVLSGHIDHHIKKSILDARVSTVLNKPYLEAELAKALGDATLQVRPKR